jgi:hypothetical protein
MCWDKREREERGEGNKRERRDKGRRGRGRGIKGREKREGEINTLTSTFTIYCTKLFDESLSKGLITYPDAVNC